MTEKTADTLDDLAGVHLPPGLTEADFDGSHAMELSPTLVAIFIPAKKLGCFYRRAEQTWTSFHPVSEDQFAQVAKLAMEPDRIARDAIRKAQAH